MITLLSFLFLSAVVSAAISVPWDSDQLFASSVSYCSPPNAILVEQFQLKFYRNNNSLGFDIHAQSVLPDLYPTVSISLVAYGISAVNQTLNLCSLFGGVICPLPLYDFLGSTVLPLPASVIPNIPSEAYIVPNLDALATVSVVDNKNGETVACIRAALSNGLSTQQLAISLPLALLILIAFLLVVFKDLWPAIGRGVEEEDIAKGRMATLFTATVTFFQHVSATGFLTLHTPGAYLGFTENFAWSNLVVRIRQIQDSLNKFGRSTGGDDESLGFVGRAVNVTYTNVSETSLPKVTFNDYPSKVNWSGSLSKKSLLDSVNDVHAWIGHDLVKRQDGAVEPSNGQSIEGIPYVQDEGELPTSGLEIVGTDLGIQPGALFMTALINLLIFLAFTVVITTLFYLLSLLVVLLARYRQRKHNKVLASRRMSPEPETNTVLSQIRGWRWRFFITMMGLRVLMMTYYPVSILAFYQFSLGKHGSWFYHLFAALTWLTITITLVFVLLTPWFEEKKGRNLIKRTVAGENPKTEANPHQLNPIDSIKECWEEYNAKLKANRGRFWFQPGVLFIGLIEAAVVGFGQSHGLLQVIFLLSLTSILFLLQVVLRPYISKFSNFLTSVLILFRIVIYGTLIPFAINNGSISSLTRAIIGFVLIGVEAAAIGFVILSAIFFGLWYAFKEGKEWWRSTKSVSDDPKELGTMREINRV